MAESPNKARRWNAFVCPACRFLFRVPVDHDGRGVVCCCCRRLLRLPQPGDETPVLLAEARPGASSDGDPAIGRESHHRRQARSHGRLPLWRTLWNGVFRSGPESQSLWVVLSVGVLVAFLGIFGIVRLVSSLGGRPADAGGKMVEDALPLTIPGELDLSPGLPQDAGGDGISPARFLLKAEPLARRFADARKVGDMLPLVRDPETTGPLMRDWYSRHGFEDVGVLRIAIDGNLGIRGRVAVLPLLMSDFTHREMAFLVDGDDYRIDWQSWVGWSEMGWPEFMDQRPDEPKLFRVRAQRGDYFNFGFNDESVWRCYELESPDGGKLLFAYGRIGSEADNRLAGVEKGAARELTLRLRYPDDAPSANQVIIEETVAVGWVVTGDRDNDAW